MGREASRAAALRRRGEPGTGVHLRWWAGHEGIKVGARGRFNADLIARYDAAHPETPYIVGLKDTPSVPKKAPSGRERNSERPIIPVQAKPAPVKVTVVDDEGEHEVPVKVVPHFVGTGGMDQKDRRASWTVEHVYTANGRNIEQGTELSFRGQPGRFKFVEHVVTPEGYEWLTVVGGPMGTAHREPVMEFRSFPPDAIRTVHSGPRKVHPKVAKIAKRKAKK